MDGAAAAGTAGILVVNIDELVADGTTAAAGAVGIQVDDGSRYGLEYDVRVADCNGVAADGGSAAGTAGFAGIQGADDAGTETVAESAGFAGIQGSDYVGSETDADGGIPHPVKAHTAGDVAAKQHHFCFQSFHLQNLDAATH